MQVNTNIGLAKSDVNKDNIVDFLTDLFARRGPESYLGEPVSMAEHMEQSACCAEEDQASDALIVAALLHDVGHFTNDFPVDALEKGTDNLHEDAAVGLLAPFYPASVTEPIRLHVAAKRYLCAVTPDYFDRLSPASVNSLNLQGGPMNAEEVKEFEANPYHKAAIKVRYYDDDGKIEGRDIQSFASYRGMLESLLK